jgi:hypothetical protein
VLCTSAQIQNSQSFPKHTLIKYCAPLSLALGVAVLGKARCKGKAPMSLLAVSSSVLFGHHLAVAFSTAQYAKSHLTVLYSTQQ